MYLDSVKDRFPQVQKRLIDLARIPSVTPPSDTKTIAEYVAATLSDIPGVAVSVLSEVNPIVNVLASVEGAKGAGHTLLLRSWGAKSAAANTEPNFSSERFRNCLEPMRV